MNTLHSINKSRTGYAYQYKYALLRILKMMLGGKIKSAEIDMPFTSDSTINLSLDLKIELINYNETYIYEIKTGDNFKKDKIKELEKTLRNLYLYEQSTSHQCKKFIIISPEAESEILDHWSDFSFIQSGNTKNLHNEKQYDVQKRVFAKFNSGSISLKQIDFIKFIKQITFTIGDSYQRDSDIDELSDLEDQIVSEINNFIKRLSLGDSTIEIPSWSIGLELLEVLYQSSENNEAILKNLFEKLKDCLCRKRILKEARYKKDRTKILDEIEDEIRDNLIDITKLTFEGTIKSTK